MPIISDIPGQKPTFTFFHTPPITSRPLPIRPVTTGPLAPTCTCPGSSSPDLPPSIALTHPHWLNPVGPPVNPIAVTVATKTHGMKQKAMAHATVTTFLPSSMNARALGLLGRSLWLRLFAPRR